MIVDMETLQCYRYGMFVRIKEYNTGLHGNFIQIHGKLFLISNPYHTGLVYTRVRLGVVVFIDVLSLRESLFI